MEDCLIREANGTNFCKISEEWEPFIAIWSILYPKISGTQLLVTAGVGCFGCVFKCVNLLYSDYLVLRNGIMFVVIINSTICTELSHNMFTNSDTFSVTLEWHWNASLHIGVREVPKVLTNGTVVIFFHSILKTKSKHPVNLSHFLVVIMLCFAHGHKFSSG